MSRRTIQNNGYLEFSQIKIRRQTTDPEISKYTTQDECPHILLKKKKKTISGNVTFKLQKILKETRGKNNLPIEEQR